MSGGRSALPGGGRGAGDALPAGPAGPRRRSGSRRTAATSRTWATFPPDAVVLVESGGRRSRRSSPSPPATGCRWSRSAARSGKSGGIAGATGRHRRLAGADEPHPGDLAPRTSSPASSRGSSPACSRPRWRSTGLFYPPDPELARARARIGGNVAENAGGPRALKYGVTREYVLGLTAVVPTGEVLRIGQPHHQGGGRLRPDRAPRGQRGDARHRHRDHAEAPAAPAPRGHRAGRASPTSATAARAVSRGARPGASSRAASS